MSTLLFRERLSAELAATKQMLAQTSNEDVLGKITLAAKAERIEREIEDLGAHPPSHAEIALVFHGYPVRGSSAIQANFGSKVIDAFQRTIATSFALDADGDIGQRGPAPHLDTSALHITGLLHGSFGFMLEEIDPRGEPLFDTELKLASDAILNLLNDISVEDENYSEHLLEEINERLFSNVRELVKMIHDNNASAEFVSPDRSAKLVGQSLARAYERISNAEIVDDEYSYDGVLVGIIPDARRFEFHSVAQNVSGRISKGIAEEYLKTLETRPLVGRKIRGVFRHRRITRADGTAKDTYTLIQIFPEDGPASHIL